MLIQAIASLREATVSESSIVHEPTTQAAWPTDLDLRPPGPHERSLQSTSLAQDLVDKARADQRASMGQSILSNYIDKFGAKVADDLGES